MSKGLHRGLWRHHCINRRSRARNAPACGQLCGWLHVLDIERAGGTGVACMEPRRDHTMLLGVACMELRRNHTMLLGVACMELRRNHTMLLGVACMELRRDHTMLLGVACMEPRRNPHMLLLCHQCVHDEMD